MKSRYLCALACAAALFGAASCSKTESGEDLPSLKVAFGSDEYSVEAGGTISLAFVVNGHESKDIDVSATVSGTGAKVEVKNPLMYQGDVIFTAPEVCGGETFVVTLTANDAKNSRTASVNANVTVGASEPLVVVPASEYRSVMCRPGGSFEIPFSVGGYQGATLSEIVLTVSPDGWSGKCVMNEDGFSGKMVISQAGAAGAGNETVCVSLVITDNFGREAVYEQSIAVTIVEAGGEEGAANSFIVAPGSIVTIKAVKGNSSEAVALDNAKLVWQSAPGMVGSVSANGAEGVLAVQLNPGVSGNALVAATKEGRITWSWHLWVCDYDPDQDPFVWTSAGGTSYTYMDRNLGALSAEKYSDNALGLLYQWGRKDPFSGAVGIENSLACNYYDIDGNQIYDSAQDRPVYGSSDHTSTTLETAVENPMVFYTSPTSSWPVVDWLTDKADLQDNDLWGGVSHIKTIYDPCPEGWMVPEAGENWNFRQEYHKEGALNDANPYDSSYPWYCSDTQHEDVGFRYRQSDGREYWFPLAGNRDGQKGSVQSVGGSGDYWTSTASSTLMNMQMFAWGNPASVSGLNRVYGASIRCIKEK